MRASHLGPSAFLRSDAPRQGLEGHLDQAQAAAIKEKRRMTTAAAESAARVEALTSQLDLERAARCDLGAAERVAGPNHLLLSLGKGE